MNKQIRIWIIHFQISKANNTNNSEELYLKSQKVQSTVTIKSGKNNSKSMLHKKLDNLLNKLYKLEPQLQKIDYYFLGQMVKKSQLIIICIICAVKWSFNKKEN